MHVDFAGIVKEVSSDIACFKVGDPVYGVGGGIKGAIGKIKPLLHDIVFNWKKVSLAHKLLESSGQKGKIVLLIE